MKTRSEFRNVSVTAAAALSKDAYAMSNLSAVKLTLLAGRGNGYLVITDHHSSIS